MNWRIIQGGRWPIIGPLTAPSPLTISSECGEETTRGQETCGATKPAIPTLVRCFCQGIVADLEGQATLLGFQARPRPPQVALILPPHPLGGSTSITGSIHDMRTYFQGILGTEGDPFHIESLQFPTGLMSPM